MVHHSERFLVGRGLWAVCGLMLCLSSSAWAETTLPTTIAVQGFVRGVGGGPAADGDYGVTISFYEAKTGGDALYFDVNPAVKVEFGVFSVPVGTVKPLDSTVFASGAARWVGVQFGSEPELPRSALMLVPYAIRAASADTLSCSGCVGAAQVDPALLTPYAKQAELAAVALSGAYADLSGKPDLAAVATSGLYADLQGTPDLSVYAKAAGLAGVAATGQYADLEGLPDLGVYAKSGDLAKVATSGAYADLSGAPDLAPYAKSAALAKVATTGVYADLASKPVLPALGTSCPSGQVVKGIKADGSLECAGAPTTLVTEIKSSTKSNGAGQTVTCTSGYKAVGCVCAYDSEATNFWPGWCKILNATQCYGRGFYKATYAFTVKAICAKVQ